MQKVVGSNPISRSPQTPAAAGAFCCPESLTNGRKRSAHVAEKRQPGLKVRVRRRLRRPTAFWRPAGAVENAQELSFRASRQTRHPEELSPSADKERRRIPGVGPLAAALACLAALALGAGCGDDDGQEEPAPAPAEQTAPATPGDAEASGGDGEPRFASIDEAVSFLDDRLDVPVVVPEGLPEGTELPDDPVTPRQPRRWAQLTLATGADEVVTIQYGRAGFDGCELPNLRRTELAPGIYASHTSGPLRVGGEKGRHSTVVWPTESRSETRATYAISGPYGRGQVLRWARSMVRQGADVPPRHRQTGC